MISSLGSSRGQALKYNGKELQEDYGLNWYDYGARFYEPAIARWHVVDPFAENNLTETPYCYVGNNPIGRIDPDGNDWMDIVVGAVSAVADNIYPGFNSAATAPVANNTDFNIGQKLGQVASILIGATETVIGGGMMGTGGAATVASGGTAAPVAVPLVAGGAVVAGHGVSMISKASANLMTGNGQKEEKQVTAEDKKFNGKQDTQSQTQKQAFNKAKDQNGIPRSQQPDNTIKVKENGTGNNLREYQYTNSKGEKVSIRKDNPRKYNEGGSGDQGNHYNAGTTEKKLKQHHNYGNN